MLQLLPEQEFGAFGDGGGIVTSDPRLTEQIRMLRNYGQRAKNDIAMLGYNSRLDTLQAAILGVKLRYLEQGNEMRRARRLNTARRSKGPTSFCRARIRM